MVGQTMIGGCGESAVAAEFLHNGIPVYTPLVDSGADLIVDINGRLCRVQVKSSLSEDHAVRFRLGRRFPGKHGWYDYDTAPDFYALCAINRGYIALVPAGRKNIKLTFDNPACADRLMDMEIGMVIGRLKEESE